MRHHFKIICIVLVFMLIIMSCTENNRNTYHKKGFYQYTEKEIAKFLTEHGYQGVDIRHVMRNSDGTKLRIYDNNNRIFIISCNGVVKVKDMPGLGWLNNEEQVVAWLDYKKKEVFYKNGFAEMQPFWFNSIDPSGTYFAKRSDTRLLQESMHNNHKPVRIFSVDEPSKTLISLNVIDDDIINIYPKDNYIYVFGLSKNNNILLILHKDGEQLVVERSIHIKSPSPHFQAIDLCPWKDEVMFVDPFDWPSKSLLYSFNLMTQEMIQVGSKEGYGFYLQCDILKQGP